MRLLIVTQVVDRNDPVLGFFHAWLCEFARHAEKVEVICLKEGVHDLPSNVRIHSLGKEKGRRSKFSYAISFWKLIWKLRYDAVFVHMNPEYVLLGALLWRIQRKPTVLWYTHRQVTLMLRLAVFLSTRVATAARESLQIQNSSKIRVLGHGIETSRFAHARNGVLHDPARVVSVGRITPLKRLELLIEALALLRRTGLSLEVTFVGGPAVPSDVAYQKRLKELAEKLKVTSALHFAGPVSYEQMPALYKSYDISVNLAPTGGIDKAVLESMASGALALAANKGFAALFGDRAAQLLFEPTPEALAEKIRALLTLSVSERAQLSEELVAIAQQKADVATVVQRIVSLLT